MSEFEINGNRVVKVELQQVRPRFAFWVLKPVAKNGAGHLES